MRSGKNEIPQGTGISSKTGIFTSYDTKYIINAFIAIVEVLYNIYIVFNISIVVNILFDCFKTCSLELSLKNKCLY